ncbi:hypothetical protein F4778DRAFT_391957 [Xylariomycetidae sp. FL2044]|nr:hypothetical protein F4778DRAFT_391957 [Xylariomycetidae sp. FL2044]
MRSRLFASQLSLCKCATSRARYTPSFLHPSLKRRVRDSFHPQAPSVGLGISSSSSRIGHHTKHNPITPGRSFTSNTMSTTTIQKDGIAIPLTLPSGLDRATIEAFPAFKNWLTTLQAALRTQHSNPSHPFHADPYVLRSITVQSYDLFGGSRLGFVKLTAEVSNAAGERLPGSVFLRGPSVAMLVMLIPDDINDDDDASSSEERKEVEEQEEERYVILTVQPRVPAGSLALVELPAGMVDDGGSFAGAAAQEIQEELGIEIPASELTCLSELAGQAGTAAGGGGEGEEEEETLPFAMYPSAGGCDEYIPVYMHERRVPRDTLSEWTGKLTGLRDHGEKITLKLVRMRDLWKEGGRDAKCLAAAALWEGLRREGKI